MKIALGSFVGDNDLPRIAEAFGFGTVAELVLDRSVFCPPSIVQHTERRPIVNTVRAGKIGGKKRVRGEFIKPEVVERLWGMPCDDEAASGVLADDNASPHYAFCASFQLARETKTTHLAHIHDSDYSKNPRYYTSLANLVLVPTWLAKLTDSDPFVQQSLRFVARVAFDFCPCCGAAKSTCAVCEKPEGLNLSEEDAMALASRYEQHRVADYDASIRSLTNTRWLLAQEAGRGYSEPYLSVGAQVQTAYGMKNERGTGPVKD